MTSEEKEAKEFMSICYPRGVGAVMKNGPPEQRAYPKANGQKPTNNFKKRRVKDSKS